MTTVRTLQYLLSQVDADEISLQEFRRQVNLLIPLEGTGSKRQRVADSLRQLHDSGKRWPGCRSVAAMFGVSKDTVSRIFKKELADIHYWISGREALTRYATDAAVEFSEDKLLAISELSEEEREMYGDEISEWMKSN